MPPRKKLELGSAMFCSSSVFLALNLHWQVTSAWHFQTFGPVMGNMISSGLYALVQGKCVGRFSGLTKFKKIIFSNCFFFKLLR